MTVTVTVAQQGAEVFTPVCFILLTFDSDISPKRPVRLRICARQNAEVDYMNKQIFSKFNAER